MGGGNDEREQTLNQLLVEMDGFEASSGVIVVAATNRADVLDKALLRPGRFDRQVMVGLPDIRGREQILNVHMRKVPIGTDVKADILARGTPGFSGADLANLVNEAALFAARRSKRLVEMIDFEDAKDKIYMGPERKSMVMREEERRNTAYHESGHAVIAKLLPKADPVHKVTIMPRGFALGLTWQLPEHDALSGYKDKMLEEISILFGGRIAEEIFVGQMSTGASNDFSRATKLARAMVTRFGMSDSMGVMVYEDSENEGFFGGATKTISEATQQKVDAEIRSILDTQYALSRRLLEENRDKVEAMTRALLDWETIDAEQINDIMAGHEPRQSATSNLTKRNPPGDSGSGRRVAERDGASLIVRTYLRKGIPQDAFFSFPFLLPVPDATFPAMRPLRLRARRHAAGDGHPQRHPRFVFRRRPLPGARVRHFARRRDGRRRRRHDRHRRRIEPARLARRAAGRRTAPRDAGAVRAARPRQGAVGRHLQARSDARSDHRRRRHDQRHQRLPRAGRARGGGRQRLRAVRDAHAEHAGNDAAATRSTPTWWAR